MNNDIISALMKKLVQETAEAAGVTQLKIHMKMNDPEIQQALIRARQEIERKIAEEKIETPEKWMTRLNDPEIQQVMADARQTIQRKVAETPESGVL